ncbi:hypothetical protein MSP7336_01805 [Mycobacterium shimoidei]|uniref:Uncharacterized protein n=1 Tax=Mycobacterium shimoidei TaxID=29313 RepID=A0A375YXH2_MYCSH|nr:hypothetical protein [Mycobacterium shimoidei]SRX93566.1 hypothetical protein MSP7336_01805 [Mycobacterium shimoidei]
MAVVRATQAFSYSDAGVPRVVTPGTLYDSDHPCVKQRPHLFEPVEVAASRRASVEDAAAEPGSRRSVSTGRGRRRSAEPGPAKDEPSESSAAGDA